MARKFNRKNILFVLISTAFLALGLIYTNCGSKISNSTESTGTFGKVFNLLSASDTKSDYVALTDDQKATLAEINTTFDDIHSKLFYEKNNLIVLSDEAFKIVSNLYTDIESLVSKLPGEYISQYKTFVSDLNVDNVADNFLNARIFFAGDINADPVNPSPVNPVIPSPIYNARISAGEAHTCAIVNMGCNEKLYCWGDNNVGQLGNSSALFETSPKEVVIPGKPIEVSAGDRHTCAIAQDPTTGVKSVYCWGNNVHGELGNHSITQSNVPVLVHFPNGETAVSIAAGIDHTCAIAHPATGNNVLYCWGNNLTGELGLGHFGGPLGGSTYYITPQLVSALPGIPEKIAMASHTCAISTVNGVDQLYCWGHGAGGKLGTGSGVNFNTPQRVPLLGSSPIPKSITAGYFHTCAIVSTSSGNQEQCWGWNRNGVLGTNVSFQTMAYTPQVVNTLAGPPLSIGAGDEHTCAITQSNKLYCWGEGLYGKLGNNGTVSAGSPQPVNLSNPTDVSSGGNHSCAVTHDSNTGKDKIYCWGHNDRGQLGIGQYINNMNDQTIPQLVGFPTVTVSPSHNTIVGISAGKFDFPYNPFPTGSFTCAVLSNGHVKCWGNNGFGELGDGTYNDSTIPVTVNNISTAVAVSVGEQHACALLSDGHVKCWGDNRGGALGNGTTTSSSIPVMVSNVSTAIAVSSGWDYTCVLLSNGQIQCWGNNFIGQLGNGTNINSSVPVTVSNISTAIAVSAGGEHACAVLSNGQIQCWGYNIIGELGNGTTINSSTPVTVSNISTAIAVSAGRALTCAVLSNGHIQCWGNNSYGMLGNGTNIDSSTPVTVNNISTALGVSASETYVCAMLSNGTINCWGTNFFGELGDGQNYSYSSQPVNVNNISTASVISSGGSHACALTCGGAKCWGANSHGGLGDGTTTDSNVPVTVLNLP